MKKEQESLEQLTSKITEENKHAEIDFGTPVGNEFGSKQIQESKIWNVSIVDSSKFITGYQFEAVTIYDAIKQGEEFGTVVKAILAEYDEE